MTDDEARCPAEEDTLERRLDQIEQALLESVDHAQRRIWERMNRLLEISIGQTEALIWLQSTLGLRSPLPPTRGWAASPDVLAELVRQIDQRGTKTVVEAGSGVSTVIMAAAMERHGGGHVYALEHLPEMAAETRAQLAAQGLAASATIVEAPLGQVTIAGQSWPWYQIPKGALPSRIDLVFVDGPPASTGPLARYPALPVLAGRLAPGALVVMDDARREEEREVAKRWLAENPDMTSRDLRTEKGTTILVAAGPPGVRS